MSAVAFKATHLKLSQWKFMESQGPSLYSAHKGGISKASTFDGLGARRNAQPEADGRCGVWNSILGSLRHEWGVTQNGLPWFVETWTKTDPYPFHRGKGFPKEKQEG